MKNFSPDKRVLDNCKIYSMLHKYSKGRHLSFHTPGHKAGAWDITELSYSDNLSCPKGVIKEAENDISEILGSAASFILTDGSTAGTCMLIGKSMQGRTPTFGWTAYIKAFPPSRREP